jgi:hypothetical protein
MPSIPQSPSPLRPAILGTVLPASAYHSAGTERTHRAISMPALSPKQIGIVQRLVSRGFVPVAFPLYPDVVGVRRGPFAALLTPAEDRLQLLGTPYYLIGENLSVRVRENGRDWFRWKRQRVEATSELVAALRWFGEELSAALEVED